MKRIVSLLAALIMLLSLTVSASAEGGRTAPEEKNPVVYTDAVNVETSFHSYDTKFYEAPSEQPGTVVRFDYTTDVYGEPIEQWANVYLPYGYDETKQYNILYFTHGTNETQDSFIGEEVVKNAIDNMIEVGIAEPFIMVCPTYYYDYENRATNHQKFVEEVRKDLMPAVEAAFSTYAETPDDAGFIASREHRAFCGYSQGGSVCWTLSYQMYDWAKWFLPFSGSGLQNLQLLKDAMAANPAYSDDIFYFIASGGKRDVAYDGLVELVNAMLADDAFRYGTDPAENNFFCAISKDVHQTLKGRFMLYNAFVDVLFK